MTDQIEQTVGPCGGALSRLRDCPPRWPLLLACWGALVGVYLIGVSARWWPTPDSAMIMSLSRSLAAGEGYTCNGTANTIIPPGLPIQLAGVRRLAGPGEWAANLFLAVTGAGSLAVIYSTFSKLADRRTALAVVLCTGFSYVFYEHSHRVLTDIPFVLLFWLVLWYWVSWGVASSKAPSRAAVAAGAALTLLTVAALVVMGVAVRFPGVVAFGIFAGAVLLGGRTLPGRGRRVALSAVVLSSAIGAVIGYRAFTRSLAGNDPKYLQRVGHALPLEVGDALGRLGDGLRVMPETASEVFIAQGGLISSILVGLPVLALILIGSVCLWKGRRRALVVLALAYPLALTLCTGHGNFRPRYLMPITPLWFYLALEGVWAAVRWLWARRGAAVGARQYLVAATVFTSVFIAANAPRLARDAFYYGHLSRTGGYYRAIGHEETVQMAELIGRTVPPDARLFVGHNRHSMIHYLTGRVVRPFPRKHSRKTADDAKALIERIRRAFPAYVLLHHGNHDGEAFTAAMRAAFDNDQYTLIHAGKEYRLYAPRLRVASRRAPAI